MAESKITQGNWKEDIGADMIDEERNVMRMIIYSDKDDFQPAHVFGRTEEELEANGRLVKAAPEMYKMLILVRTVLLSKGVNYDNADHYNEINNLILDIQKA